MRQVLEHGHFVMGPEIAELEGKLARYVGVKHAITVASGTDSLEIALRALGVGPGQVVGQGSMGKCRQGRNCTGTCFAGTP
jgi:UDP-2-acetamido-2-deoxy-ribo-hexuluronate aminotransferase